MSAALLSDLVRDSKLDTTTTGNDIVRHVIEVADHISRRRRVRQEQLWKRMESLGEGAYGEVWLEKLVGGTCHVNERAVKVIKKRTQKQRPVDYSRELEAIAKFSHPKYNSCFVKSFGWFENDRNVFITMEYFPLGDLQDYLSHPLPETEVQQIAFQIVEGLKFMHHNGFAHRDLKPSNILIKSLGPEWWVKIGDFGISKRAEEGLTALRTFSGTLGFLAPEVLVQNGFLDCDEFGELQEYTVAVDIWSLGEIVFRALVNNPPFPTGLASYVKGTASFPDQLLRSHGITDNGRDFVRKLLLPMPTDRLSAEDALEHPWVESQKSASPRPSGELERSQLIVPDTHSKTGIANNRDQSPTVASAVWSTIQTSIDEDIRKSKHLTADTRKVKLDETAESTVVLGTAGLNPYPITVLPTLFPRKTTIESTPPQEPHLALKPPVLQELEILRDKTTIPKNPIAHREIELKEKGPVEVFPVPQLARPPDGRSRPPLAARGIQASGSQADSSGKRTSQMIMNTRRQRVDPEEPQREEASRAVRPRRRPVEYHRSQADGSGTRRPVMIMNAQRQREEAEEPQREKTERPVRPSRVAKAIVSVASPTTTKPEAQRSDGPFAGPNSVISAIATPQIFNMQREWERGRRQEREREREHERKKFLKLWDEAHEKQGKEEERRRLGEIGLFRQEDRSGKHTRQTTMVAPMAQADERREMRRADERRMAREKNERKITRPLKRAGAEPGSAEPADLLVDFGKEAELSRIPEATLAAHKHPEAEIPERQRQRRAKVSDVTDNTHVDHPVMYGNYLNEIRSYSSEDSFIQIESTPLEYARREGLDARRAKREKAREKQDQVLPEDAPDGPPTIDLEKAITLKGFISASVTTSSSLSFIHNEIVRALRENDVRFTNIHGGYSCTHTRTFRVIGFSEADVETRGESFETSDVKFEIHIVKLPLVPVHGIRFKKVAGQDTHFRRVKDKILVMLERL